MAAQASVGKARRGQIQGRKERAEKFSAEEGEREDLARKECGRQEENPKPDPSQVAKGLGAVASSITSLEKNIYFAFLSKDLVR